ncbi:FMN-dependent NADH-azoreductase [Dyadobacter chenhuakuii]|uniref:FMN dependent NADH:quinone oxidoreductase n=1 Tax=Dyadobacter chenhuakuii TaxID=2909339 RepID=A0A9X1U398_9BACT|nr:NAD(P)H-dependent oxidoreductase [Dyadobacter chenhuakuii]MCF2501311.1 NAD(P)H-dependent oxidoreductase [Dyadobacter chenhuakuii]
MKILHIDCSVRNEESDSRQLSGYFLGQLRDKNSDIQVDYLDLAVTAPRHPSPLFIEGIYCPPDQRTPEMLEELAESDTLVDRMLDAELYVIGMPMYNFTVPSIFKAFIDNIVRAGRTYRGTSTGIEGVLTDKRAVVINTRGVDFSQDKMASMDQLQPYLTTIFGFIGLTDIHFINVFPVKFSSEELRNKAILNAQREIAAMVESL